MYTYINMYMYMYIHIYIHIYIIIYESFLFARSPCRAAWVVPKIPEGSISNVIGREVWEEGEAPRALIIPRENSPHESGGVFKIQPKAAHRSTSFRAERV